MINTKNNNQSNKKSIFFTKTKTQHPEKKEKRNTIYLKDLFISEKEQKREMNMLYLGSNFERKHLYTKEIKNKASSYKIQDEKQQRNIEDINEFQSFYESIVELLVKSKLQCSYCLQDVVILYQDKYQQNQWTLDRKENDENHHISNCVISCLSCNISKRRRSDQKFRFTKQLNIKKII